MNQKIINLINIGDILFFHRQSKQEFEPTKKIINIRGTVDIYLGDNNFIHCTRTKGKVTIDNFKKKILEKNISWKQRYYQ